MAPSSSNLAVGPGAAVENVRDDVFGFYLDDKVQILLPLNRGCAPKLQRGEHWLVEVVIRVRQIAPYRIQVYSTRRIEIDRHGFVATFMRPDEEAVLETQRVIQLSIAASGV